MPFSAVKGLGGAAAEGIMSARAEGEFFSCDDLQTRSGLSRTLVDTLREMGALGDLPATSQVNLFEL